MIGVLEELFCDLLDLIGEVVKEDERKGKD